MPGPPPPPPQYSEEPDKPPEDWVPPAKLVEEVSNDPNINPTIKDSIQERAYALSASQTQTEENNGQSNSGPPPPPPPSGVNNNNNNNNKYETVNDTSNVDYDSTSVIPPTASITHQDEDIRSSIPAAVAESEIETENQNETIPGPSVVATEAPAGYDFNNNNNNIDNGFNVTSMLSTGNLLEDLDNMLRIYRMTIDDIERSKLFIEFWKKFNELKLEQPKELLKIPTKVRGFLYVLEYIPPYQADQIMKDLLSEGGLLAEPEYIERRYILKLFTIYEFGNIFSWLLKNIKTLKAWMFIFSLTLTISITTHIFVDFYFGNVWRALLMEFLVPISLISTSQFIDTPFFACVIRVIIEDNCSALATIPGRIFFNILIVFFCIGSWELQDIAILLSAFFVGIWTFIIGFTYSRLMSSSSHVRILCGSSNKLESKFLQYDQDRDGVLNIKELQLFFESFRQQMSNWQLEMMIMQYDIQRDNGLRFESMDIWFRKQPINSDTRSQLLSSKPREFYGIQDTQNNNKPAYSQQEMEWKNAGLAGMQRDSKAQSLALAALGAS